MNFPASETKPVGYVAKDAIYNVIDQLIEDGLKFENITNGQIHTEILKLYGVDEKLTTLSSYKSQYKNRVERGSVQARELMSVCLKIAPILKQALQNGLPEKSLKEAILTTLEAVINDLD